jgi:hypothetical protein
VKHSLQTTSKCDPFPPGQVPWRTCALGVSLVPDGIRALEEPCDRAREDHGISKRTKSKAHQPKQRHSTNLQYSPPPPCARRWSALHAHPIRADTPLLPAGSIASRAHRHQAYAAIVRSHNLRAYKGQTRVLHVPAAWPAAAAHFPDLRVEMDSPSVSLRRR